MHIPENYLSPTSCAAMAAVAVPAFGFAIAKAKKEITKDKMPLLGIFAAFSFIVMMFNLPMPGGTTGHAVGGTLIAILLGPEAACISISVALIIQALMFGDGGILAIGANCFNIGFVLPMVGYAVYLLISVKAKSSAARYIGAGLGSYIGINAAALLTALELGIQPYLFKGADGTALYCPYGLEISIPAMMLGHLTIFGLAEVIFTVSILAFIDKTSPETSLKKPQTKKGTLFIGAILGVLIILSPLGLLASGTAWGEWSAQELSEIIGYVPKGIQNGILSDFEALFPDYSIGALPKWVAYILSAVIGISVLIIIFKLISTFMKSKVNFDE